MALPNSFNGSLIQGTDQISSGPTKIMELQSIVSDILGIPVDQEVIEAAFTFASGYISGINPTFSAKGGGVSLTDSTNSDKWRITVDGDAELDDERVIFQHWNGSAWDDILSISPFDIYHDNLATTDNSLFAALSSGDSTDEGGTTTGVTVTINTPSSGGLSGGSTTAGSTWDLRIATNGILGHGSYPTNPENSMLAAGAIGPTDIGIDAVDSQHIAAGAIDNEHMGVRPVKIANINAESSTTGQVPTSLGNGTATWQTPSAGGVAADYGQLSFIPSSPTIPDQTGGQYLVNWSTGGSYTRKGDPSSTQISISAQPTYVKLNRTGLWRVTVTAHIDLSGISTGHGATELDRIGLEVQHRTSTSSIKDYHKMWNPIIDLSGSYFSPSTHDDQVLELTMTGYKESTDLSLWLVQIRHENHDTANSSIDLSKLVFTAEYLGS